MGIGEDSNSDEDSQDWRADFDKTNKDNDTEMIIKFNVGF